MCLWQTVNWWKYNKFSVLNAANNGLFNAIHNEMQEEEENKNPCVYAAGMPKSFSSLAECTDRNI